MVGGYTLDQARELAALSRSIGRQIGLCIDRRGRVSMVIVGSATGILIPELPRARESAGRLRGFRLLHTHLTPDLLSQEDCMDMLFLRLDGMAVLTVDQWGSPVLFQRAHLLPFQPDNKQYMVHSPTQWDDLSVNFAEEATALEDEFARSSSVAVKQENSQVVDDPLMLMMAQSQKMNEGFEALRRAVVVGVSADSRVQQMSMLVELVALAATAGVAVVGSMSQRVKVVDPKFIIGRGKLTDLEVLALQQNAGLIIFDGELSPSQLRNISAVTKRPVLDRTQLILDIFAQRAKSRAGKLQVELAQLQYMLPRLVGKSSALDRLAGGIGGRGPGETKLETDRRRLRERIARVKQELSVLRKQRGYTRARRNKTGIPVVSLVGYTNAGKSTLLNKLTGSDVLAEDKLFATLDPTTRRLRFPQERELIVTDTVGFIRNLPQQLMEAFRATLEELEEAQLLLHVADASHPEVGDHIAAVDEILSHLELQDTPQLLVLNKIDSLGTEQQTVLREIYPGAFFISAASGQGVSMLSDEIYTRIDWARRTDTPSSERSFHVPSDCSLLQ